MGIIIKIFLLVAPIVPIIILDMYTEQQLVCGSRDLVNIG